MNWHYATMCSPNLILLFPYTTLFRSREKALRVLRARLYEMKLAEQQEAIGAQRKNMVRSGNRSEKIRTYNFKDNRVTDHRSEEHTSELQSHVNLVCRLLHEKKNEYNY